MQTTISDTVRRKGSLARFFFALRCACGRIIFGTRVDVNGKLPINQGIIDNADKRQQNRCTALTGVCLYELHI